jgi:hypothetical protein
MIFPVDPGQSYDKPMAKTKKFQPETPAPLLDEVEVLYFPHGAVKPGI